MLDKMNEATEKDNRTASVGLRLYPSMKEALDRAAKEEHRTTANLIEYVLIQWLQQNRYMPKPRSEA